MIGGGLAAAAIGRELELGGAKKAIRSFSSDDKEAGAQTARIGRGLQKYGHISTGGGAALGVKSQLDDESKLEKDKKRKKK